MIDFLKTSSKSSKQSSHVCFQSSCISSRLFWFLLPAALWLSHDKYELHTEDQSSGASGPEAETQLSAHTQTGEHTPNRHCIQRGTVEGFFHTAAALLTNDFQFFSPSPSGLLNPRNRLRQQRQALICLINRRVTHGDSARTLQVEQLPKKGGGGWNTKHQADV